VHTENQQPEWAARLAQRLYAQLDQESAVQTIWVSHQQGRADFWIVTEPTSADVERRIYSLAGMLHAEHGEAPIEIHVLNPNLALRGQREVRTRLHEADATEISRQVTAG
jgi:alkyl hydroperoxide reductase subunit AhpC